MSKHIWQVEVTTKHLDVFHLFTKELLDRYEFPTRFHFVLFTGYLMELWQKDWYLKRVVGIQLQQEDNGIYMPFSHQLTAYHIASSQHGWKRLAWCKNVRNHIQTIRQIHAVWKAGLEIQHQLQEGTPWQVVADVMFDAYSEDRERFVTVSFGLQEWDNIWGETSVRPG